MKKFLRRLTVTTVVLAAAAFVGVAGWSSERLLHPDRRQLQDYHREILSKPGSFGLQVTHYTGPAGTPCLMVTPTSRPGLSPKGRLVRDILVRRGVPLAPQGEIRGTIVLLHGFCGRKEDNLPIAERLCAAGFRCILPDLPGHGDNPAGSATFGLHESQLPEQLLEDAARRFAFAPAPAALFGISQGGAIALQAAARPGNRWTAVASVSAFASLDQPVSNIANRLTPQMAMITPMTSGACACGVRCREGFYPSDIRPVEAASRIHIPAFIIHGDRDDFIPIASGRAIYDAIPDSRKTFLAVKGANHGDVLSSGSHELYADICRFYLEAAGPALLVDGKSGAKTVRRR